MPKSLHGGYEPGRVSLALLFVKPSNVIILDEPTNFIDLDTIEALESFIEAYEGTVILTSHDKYLSNGWRISSTGLKMGAYDCRLNSTRQQ